MARLRTFLQRLSETASDQTYEAAHARLALSAMEVIAERQQLMAAGKLTPLPDPKRAAAADQCYVDTANQLYAGLEKLLQSYAGSKDPRKRKVAEAWR
jgi:hypothetical protein